MKRLAPLFPILFLLTFSLKLSAKTQFPQPVGAVNDFASVISEPEKTKMENLCREILDKTRTSIVIATVESIGDDTIETYANELYRNWGIGMKGEDRGVLILLALKERRVRIETGYGVEGILPDGLVGQILDDSIIPYCKKGKYGEGLYIGLVSLSQVIAKDAGIEISGKYRGIKPSGEKTAERFPLLSLPVLLLFLFIVFGPFIWPWLFLSGMSGRSRRYYRSGGFGSFGGGFGGFGGGLSGGGGASRGF
jgi:uncharacterized protein